ncbi:hypothetical protein UlMin_040086 [Ulmus minor]
MNNIEVEIIYSKIIKPSSPTPNHLRHYQLSLIDQQTPRIHNPFLFYYALNGDQAKSISEISHKLSNSLSQALSLYYPLAGREIDDQFVDCNDEGIPFLETRVKSQLSDFVKNPVDPEELNKLLPFTLDERAESALVAIGICISHHMADALSSIIFIKTWMEIARGEENNIVRPDFISVEFFPPKNVDGYDPTRFISKNITTKRFVFDAFAIEALREKYEQNNKTLENPRRPSRVDVVSAFIWTRFMATIINPKLSLGQPEKFYTVGQAVNLRPKFDPPLPEHSFGNYYWVPVVAPPLSSGEESCSWVIKKIKEEIRNGFKDYVEKLQKHGQEHLDTLKKGHERFIREEVVCLVCTSLCRFPLYETDFGFGKPIWVSSAARPLKNTAGFMDTKEGDGIEAYISLKDEEMALFEVDEEFLAYVSPIG